MQCVYEDQSTQPPPTYRFVGKLALSGITNHSADIALPQRRHRETLMRLPEGLAMVLSLLRRLRSVQIDYKPLKTGYQSAT